MEVVCAKVVGESSLDFVAVDGYHGREKAALELSC